MKRAVAIALALAPLSLLTACNEPDSRGSHGLPYDSREALMQRCYDAGGAYFEYEATSAGAHIWCVSPDGKDIHVEGDGNHD